MNTKEQKFNLAIGTSRTSSKWINQEYTWGYIVRKLATPIKMKQTVTEFHNMPKEERNHFKDHGGFVAAYCDAGFRKNASIKFRSMITLDLDFCEKDISKKYNQFTFKALVYSTASHTTIKPRHRIIVPFSRNVSREEYCFIVREFVKTFNFTDNIDVTSYDANRLMYWPVIPEDGEYFFKVYPNQDNLIEGELYDGKSVLVDGWQNIAQWNINGRETRNIENAILKKQKDPTSKSGIIGSFCKEYNIRDTIELFLKEEYIECQNRYTWAKGEGFGGLILYDNDNFCYSHHSTDPTCGILCNSFDLIKYHKFNGNRRDTLKWCAKQKGVNVHLAKEAFSQNFSEETFDWRLDLETDINKNYIESRFNYDLIIKNTYNIWFNEFSNDFMNDDQIFDWDNMPDVMIGKIESKYHLHRKSLVVEAIRRIGLKNRKHPIKEYLENLPKWDGVKRVETLFSDYFDAENNSLNRAFARKFLSAAYQRIYNPGIEFQHQIQLKGLPRIGKSTLFKVIFSKEYFTDDFLISEIRDKTAAEKIQSKWIIENAEGAGFTKTEQALIKAFFSREEDYFRPSYGRLAKAFKRQCVFFTTTNMNLLNDITGNRRYWVVEVNKRTKDMFSIQRNQIWAEVKECFSNEELRLPSMLEAQAEQVANKNLDVDNRISLVEKYLDEPIKPKEEWQNLDILSRRKFLDKDDLTEEKAYGVQKQTKLVKREYVSCLEVWCECFGYDKAKLTRSESNEITKMLISLGWQDMPKNTIRDKNYGVIKVKFRPL